MGAFANVITLAVQVPFLGQLCFVKPLGRRGISWIADSGWPHWYAWLGRSASVPHGWCRARRVGFVGLQRRRGEVMVAFDGAPSGKPWAAWPPKG